MCAGLLTESDANTVLTMEETTSEELAVDAKVRAAISSRGRLKTFWGHTMFHIDDLPYASDLSDLPDTFTPCRKTIEAKCKVRSEVPTPKKGELGALPQGLPSGALADVAWERIPLDAAVKEAGPPQDHEKAAMHFRVRNF
jgi:deoxyribodipyrimidine photolyase